MAARPLRLVLVSAALCTTYSWGFGADGAAGPPDNMASLIKAGLPGYEDKAVEAKPQAAATAPSLSHMDTALVPDVVRMSPYIMREKRPLTDEIVLNKKGLTDMAMDKYLGSTDSLSRGFLNAYTLPELWKKIPVLGILDFVGPNGTETNEDRSMRLFRADQKAEILNEFKDFVLLGKTESSSGSK